MPRYFTGETRMLPQNDIKLCGRPKLPKRWLLVILAGFWPIK